MSLRQLWLRMNLLAREESPLRRAMAEAHAETKERERAAALDDVHNRYKPKG